MCDGDLARIFANFKVFPKRNIGIRCLSGVCRNPGNNMRFRQMEVGDFIFILRRKSPKYYFSYESGISMSTKLFQNF